MSTPNETIAKLSNALNTLIGAYEELQKENNKLTTQVKNITEEKDKLALEKEQVIMDMNNLQKDVTVLSDNSNQQNDSMYSMLSKIESLLGGETAKQGEDENLSEEILEAQLDEVISDAGSLYENRNISSNEENIKENNKSDDIEIEQSNNKIDLNRMASLLNGFNK